MLSGGTWYRFRTTRWSLVGLVRSRRQADGAMDSLTRIYYPAVYAYLRRLGIDAEAADECAQGFFADVVVGRRLFERLDPRNGRARDYLLKALENYQRDQHRREVVRGKGRRLSGDALEREEAFIATQNGSDPAAAFDKRLAIATLEEALARCERHYIERGMSSHWAAVEARVALPAQHGVEPLPLAHLAKELGFRTPADVAAAVQTVERRAAVLIRQVLAEASPNADADAEHRSFLAALTTEA